MSGRQQAGFTLLELLAAVVLLAVGFFVVFSALGQTSRSLARDENITRMALLAQSLFAEQDDAQLQPGHWQGEEAGVQWQLNCRQVRISPPVALFELDLALQSQDRREHFKTLRAVVVRGAEH
ncbi:MAG: hypothetical protein GAK43_02545 [Stenotrophomonas maltophilia]|nr:MAG: hypothetical protein GAK43_02545 [Stenotrophomonas maltophilia]